jgi:hypothetical protein
MGKQERMVVRSMAGKDDSWVLETRERWRQTWELTEVQFIGDTKPYQLGVEPDAFFQLREVKAEMSEPPDLEGPRQEHSTDVILSITLMHTSPPVRIFLSVYINR